MGSDHGGLRTSKHARRMLAAVLVPAFVATAIGAWLLWPDGSRVPSVATSAPGTAFAEATVTAVDPTVLDGPQVSAVLDDGEPIRVQTPPEHLSTLDQGDRIKIAILPAEITGGGPAHIFVDFVRGPPMLLLAGVLGFLVVVVARWRGLAAIAGLLISLGAVGLFTVPALLTGRPAGPVALVSASMILFVTLYLAHGLSARTSSALAGTLVGIVLTAGIGAWATGAARLTGLSGENGLDLLYLAPDTSLRGLLLCGLVLAGLGVLNDVTITQASAVWELRAAAPTASRRHIFGQAMRIGRDHIASTIYTMAFAYIGAALPLVLLVAISDRRVLDVLAAGEIAEEVVRTLVGSIGLVLAIPVTTAISVTVAGRQSVTRTDDRDLVTQGERLVGVAPGVHAVGTP